MINLATLVMDIKIQYNNIIESNSKVAKNISSLSCFLKQSIMKCKILNIFIYAYLYIILYIRIYKTRLFLIKCNLNGK